RGRREVCVRRNWLKWLFTFEGRVGGVEYFVAGVLLAGLKIALDWWLTGHFVGRSYLWGSDLPVSLWGTTGVTRTHGGLYGMLAVTIPFFWMGISLTVR